MIPPDDTSGSSERAPVLSFVVRRDGSLLHAHRLLPDVQVLASPGASIFDYVARPYHARVRTVLERVFSGVAERCLCRGAPPAAEQTWFQCFARPNREEGAKPIQTATFIACDVTEMKQVEDQLRQERDRLQHELVGATREISTYRDSDPGVQRFRAIMEQAGDAIFVTDAVAEQIVDLNETACHWLGSARTDVIQRRVDDVRAGFPLIPPEAAAARFTETRRIPRPWVSDRGTVRRKDGTTFAVEVAAQRQRLGDRDYVLTVVRDVRRRQQVAAVLRETEERYRGLFELSHDAIYLCTRDGMITEANEAAAMLFGFGREEFRGLDSRKLYRRPDDIHRFQEAAQSQFIRDLPVELRTKAGHPIAGFLTITIRHDEDGGILGFQCVITPIAPTAPPPRRKAPDPPPPDPRPDPDPSTAGPPPEVDGERRVPGGLRGSSGWRGKFRNPPRAVPPRGPAKDDISDAAKPDAEATGQTGHALVHVSASRALASLAHCPRPNRRWAPEASQQRPAPAVDRATHAGSAKQWRGEPRGAEPASAAPPLETSARARMKAVAAGVPRPQGLLHLWTVAAVLGAALAVVGFIDLALLWLPLRFDRAEWVFATTGAHFDHMLVATLGLTLVAFASAHHGWKRLAHALVMAFSLVAVGLVGVYGIYVLTAPLAWESAAAQLGPAIERAVAKVSGFTAAYVSLYAGLALYLTRRINGVMERA
jgi:PAS domain S-box-containing protein